MDLIDTSVLILGMQNLAGQVVGADPVKSERAAEYLLNASEAENPPIIPALVVSEFFVKVAEADQAAVIRFMNSRFSIAPYDIGASMHSARLLRENLAERERHGGRVCAKVDAMIAAIALANGATRIVTYNPAHFQVVADRLEVVEPPEVEKAQPLDFELN